MGGCGSAAAMCGFNVLVTLGRGGDGVSALVTGGEGLRTLGSRGGGGRRRVAGIVRRQRFCSMKKTAKAGFQWFTLLGMTSVERKGARAEKAYWASQNSLDCNWTGARLKKMKEKIERKMGCHHLWAKIEKMNREQAFEF
jgi:hypothetical protein